MALIPEPLRIPDYRRFWAARFCAVLATMGMVVIIGYQVYDTARADYGMSIREASFQLGLLGLVQFVPLALLTPVAGWAADRFERRTVARLANGIDLTAALALGYLTMNDALTLPLLFIFAAFHGAARAFSGPAMQAIAPNLVPPAMLPKAIALGGIAWQTGSVIGPAIGGLLYAVDPALPYWLTAGLLAAAILFMTPIKKMMPPPIAGNSHPLRQMIDGLTYVRGHRFLLGAITLDLFAVLLGGATAMLPVFARDILQVGTEGLGLLRAAPAAGAALVALYFTWLPLRHNVGMKMLLAVAAFGALTVIFGLSTSMLLSMMALFVMGGVDMLSVYVRSSLIQLHTPDAMRGRVSAVAGLAVSASNELGEMQSGLAAAIIGPVAAVAAGGAAAMGIAGLWAYLFPELRRAKTFDPPDSATATALMEEKLA